eukprot:TRINITY_DN2437_c0_g2_i7.p1 TRINITY_DN2437_c0_g2~~TRINITY_DN2437_c0_g2_i7.p1  ORF type:complete len:124 (-),score=13.17 TRINITY_DN2437_c0_g2_i7:351-722(-)
MCIRDRSTWTAIILIQLTTLQNQDSYVDEKVDIWSLGVNLYKMSVAYKPTQIGGYVYGSGPIPFRKVDWKRRSKELQDLVTLMLEFDPVKRPSAKEILQHPWFSVQAKKQNNNNNNHKKQEEN